MPDDDFQKVFKILEQNEDKNFVKRIFSPEKYPSIPDSDNRPMTHKMATAEADGKYYVYPTVVQKKDGFLYDLGAEDWTAFDYARANNEAISFDTKKEAEWFEKNWKLMWDKNFKADY